MSTILTAAFQTIQRDSAICFPMLGNLTINPPSYFTVFGFKIYFYGVIIALGFILGIVCCTRICARFGIKDAVNDGVARDVFNIIRKKE